jgi:hypothetical protein
MAARRTIDWLAAGGQRQRTMQELRGDYCVLLAHLLTS